MEAKKQAEAEESGAAFTRVAIDEDDSDSDRSVETAFFFEGRFGCSPTKWLHDLLTKQWGGGSDDGRKMAGSGARHGAPGGQMSPEGSSPTRRTGLGSLATKSSAAAAGGGKADELVTTNRSRLSPPFIVDRL